MAHSRRKKNKAALKPEVQKPIAIESLQDDPCAQKRFVVGVSIILFAFGVYQSVLFYGFAPFPHPDSFGFIRTGHELLSFEIPTSFKRAPVICVLQALLSELLPVAQKDLHAGWLLNALLHPFSVVLLWLIGRRLVGNVAAWLVIVLAINPWVILRLTESIAETPLLFFMLLTVYCIFRRSKWAYVFASIATMTRYDVAGLILAVFVVELIDAKNKRERVLAIVWAFLALLPLALWVLGTVLMLRLHPGQSHYFKHYSGREKHLIQYFYYMWEGAMRPFLPTLGRALVGGWAIGGIVSMVCTAVMFVFGVVYGWFRRRRETVAMLILVVTYMLVHGGRDSVKIRYYAPLFWIVFFVCAMALRGCWTLINRRQWLGVMSRSVLLALVVLVCLVASSYLLPFPDILDKYGPRTMALPYVAMAVVGVIFIVRRFFCGMRAVLCDVSMAALVCLMITCSQFTLVSRVTDGRRDFEFVQLVQWYRQHGDPGEKMVATLPKCMGILAPDLAENFVVIPDPANKGQAAFVQDCLEKGIVYVTWDSRLGNCPHNHYYKAKRLDKIQTLKKPRSTVVINDSVQNGQANRLPVAYYEFLERVGSKRRYINIFRLHRMKLKK